MPPFQYHEFVNPYAASIGELLLHRGDAAAHAAEVIGSANARAAEIGGQAWAGAAQNIGADIGAIPRQMQQQKIAALTAEKTKAEIVDLKAQADQRAAAAKKAQVLDQQNGYIDNVMNDALVVDPETGVASFKRDRAEQGLIKSGMGHLYPQLAETFDKLDASASKRNAESRTMLGDTLVGIGKMGYTHEAALSGAAYLKKNRVVGDDQLQAVLGELANDPSPPNVKRIVDTLGQSLPSYQNWADAEAKRQADLAKTTAETAKLTAETTGTMPATPAQQELARHNRETERISALSEGKAEAALTETARHNRATEAQAAETNAAAPALTPDAIKLTARQFAMTGQLPPMGMGKQGAKVRTDIINAAAEEYKNLDLPTQVAAYKANQASLTKLQGQRDAIGSFEATAKKNIDLFLETAGKVVDTGSPLINTPLRMVSGKLLGSPDQAAFDAARQVAVNEIAKITSNPTLAGTLSDSARHEIEAFNPASATLKQSVAVMRLLKQDMGNRTTSLDDQIKAIQQRIATKPGETSAAPMRQSIPGHHGQFAVSTDGGKTWKAE